MMKKTPMTITIDDKTYTLEFNRKTVADAADEGFEINEESGNNIMKFIPDLFYHSFKMHHPEVDHDFTDDILFNALEGLSEDEIEKLTDLYQAPYETLVRSSERKNSRVTVRI